MKDFAQILAAWQEAAAVLDRLAADWRRAEHFLALPQAQETAALPGPSPADLRLLLGAFEPMAGEQTGRAAVSGAGFAGGVGRSRRGARQGQRVGPGLVPGSGLAGMAGKLARQSGQGRQRLGLARSGESFVSGQAGKIGRASAADVEAERLPELAARLSVNAAGGAGKVARAGVEKEAAAAGVASAVAFGDAGPEAMAQELAAAASPTGLADSPMTLGRKTATGDMAGVDMAWASLAGWPAEDWPGMATAAAVEQAAECPEYGPDRAADISLTEAAAAGVERETAKAARVAEADPQELAEAVAAILCEDIEAWLGGGSFVD